VNSAAKIMRVNESRTRPRPNPWRTASSAKIVRVNEYRTRPRAKPWRTACSPRQVRFVHEHRTPWTPRSHRTGHVRARSTRLGCGHWVFGSLSMVGCENCPVRVMNQQ
jgi:hypothetical protein